MESLTEYEKEFIGCCEKGYTNAIRLFIKDGVNVKVDNEIVMKYACIHNDIDLVNLLLDECDFTNYDRYLNYIVNNIENKLKASLAFIFIERGAQFDSNGYNIFRNHHIINSKELVERLIYESNLMSACDIMDCVRVMNHTCPFQEFIELMSPWLPPKSSESVLRTLILSDIKKEYFDYFIQFVDKDNYIEILMCRIENIDILCSLAELGCYINIDIFLKNQHYISLNLFRRFYHNNLLTEEFKNDLVNHYESSPLDWCGRLSSFIEIFR